jgi:tetratricopeptide (TPR) repeat protein
MLARLSAFLREESNRSILTLLGGGAAAVIAGLWAVATFTIDHSKTEDKKPIPSVSVSGPGIATGGNATFQGSVTIGPSGDQIAQIQKPLKDQLDAQNAQIVALTKLLSASRSTVAPPGGEQELKKSVSAIVVGAAQDQRYAEAVKLLEAGNVAGAEPLLEAVAQEKAKQSENDAKGAAAAYRRLGAIAGLRDPKKAREAYAQAARLDPTDPDGLLWNGSFEFDAGHLGDAKASYEKLLSLDGQGAATDQIMWAHNGLGDVLVAQGKLPEALQSYQAGRAIADRLAQSDPGNAGWQRDLLVLDNEVADVLVAQGKLPEALQSYQASHAIFDRLAQSDPGNTGWQRDLSVSDENVGDVLVAQGKLPEALLSFQASRAIRDRLAQSDPGNAGWQRDLSVSDEKVGDVLVAQGKLPEALQSYQASRAIADRLAQSDPGNAGWQRDLAVSYAKLADIYMKSGQSTKAREALVAGHAILVSLVARYPDWAQWKDNLAWFDQKIAALKK